MDYCGPRGIPHSRFLSWEQDDQDKALAWMEIVDLTCKQCGTRIEEWENDRFAYVGQAEYCPGCEVLGQEQENVPDGARGYVKVFLMPRHLARPPDED